MEECLDFTKAKQCRLVGCRLRKAHDEACMRTYIGSVTLNPLTLVFCHPCSVLLAFAWIEVNIEQSEVCAVLIEYFKSLDIGIINWDVFILLECYSI